MNKKDETVLDTPAKIGSKAIDILYSYYEINHSIAFAVWLRPSEDWHEDPGDLLTKEEFIKFIENDAPTNYAFNVLIFYMLKQNKI